MATSRTRSIADIQAEIDRLQKEADAIKTRELAEVIDRIKTAIAHYNLTAEDLGFVVRARRSAHAAGARSKTRRAKRAAGVIKFRDEAGNAWTGVGKRPRWYLQALASGKKPEELLVR